MHTGLNRGLDFCFRVTGGVPLKPRETLEMDEEQERRRSAPELDAINHCEPDRA